MTNSSTPPLRVVGRWLPLAGAVCALAGGIAKADAGSGDTPALKVSIAVAEHNGQRPIVVSDKTSHFHVVIENVSPQPQRIWRQSCSWGYYALSFEIVDDTGRRTVASKKPITFKQNTPDFSVLASGEKLVRDVYLGSRQWRGFPIPPQGESRHIRMRAVLEISADNQSKKHGVWAGKVVSLFQDYVIENRSN